MRGYGVEEGAGANARADAVDSENDRLIRPPACILSIYDKLKKKNYRKHI